MQPQHALPSMQSSAQHKLARAQQAPPPLQPSNRQRTMDAASASASASSVAASSSVATPAATGASATSPWLHLLSTLNAKLSDLDDKYLKHKQKAIANTFEALGAVHAREKEQAETVRVSQITRTGGHFQRSPASELGAAMSEPARVRGQI